MNSVGLDVIGKVVFVKYFMLVYSTPSDDSPF